MITVVLTYSGVRLRSVFNRSTQSVSRFSAVRAPDMDTQEFTPHQQGFDMSFGLKAPLDPSIGYFTVREQEQIVDPNNGTTRVRLISNMNFDLCGMNHFNYSNTTFLPNYGISSNQCVLDDYVLFG